MKKILLSLVAVCTLGLANAQKAEFEPAQGALLDGKTIVKANLTSLATRNLAFYAERMITKNLSVQLGFTTMLSGKLPLASMFKSQPMLNDIAIGATLITPELRYYIGSGYGSGFYLAPYFRYETYSLSGLTFAASAGKDSPAVDLKLSGTLTAMGGGLLLGYQWKIGKHKNFILDWSIIGGHYGTAKGTFEGKLQDGIRDLTQEEMQTLGKDIKQTIDDLPLNVKDRVANITPRGAEISGKSPFGFFRMGLSVGYRF